MTRVSTQVQERKFRRAWCSVGVGHVEVHRHVVDAVLVPADEDRDRGVVRRCKVDVAADIPARRIADLPSSWTDRLAGRSGRPSGTSSAG
jgi:hypothetical protein